MGTAYSNFDHRYGMWFIEGSDMTELMSRAVDGHIDLPAPDAVLNIETHLYHTCLYTPDYKFDLDVGRELWLNRSRWSRLIREYVPLEPLNRFIDQAVEIVTGESRQGATANMMFRDPDRYAKKHRWGGCLMGATFRGSPKDPNSPCLTIYSRTTYMGYMALLDAAIANRIAAAIAEKSGYEGDIAFRWFITSQQLHCFKTLPYVFSKKHLFKELESLANLGRERLKKKRSSMSPTWYHMTIWYLKIIEAYKQHGNDMLSHEKYGPFKRIKRRWMEHMGHSKKNVPPTLKVEALSFEKAV